MHEGVSSCEMCFGLNPHMQTNTARDRTKPHVMQTMSFPWKAAAQHVLPAVPGMVTLATSP